VRTTSLPHFCTVNFSSAVQHAHLPHKFRTQLACLWRWGAPAQKQSNNRRKVTRQRWGLELLLPALHSPQSTHRRSLQHH
jgi:hypothetical protein